MNHKRTPKELKEREEANKGRITRWLNPNTIIHSEYGLITNEKWVEREAKRLRGVVKNRNGLTAVFGKEKKNEKI